MKKYDVLYGIRIKYFNNPYFQIYQGNFRFEDRVMAKVQELKTNPAIEKIKVTRTSSSSNPNFSHKRVYSYDQGFETFYTRPAGY